MQTLQDSSPDSD